MEIHDRIRELRVKAGFTQSDIASYLHTDVSYYSKYERGLHPLPLRHLKSLCELYHVSADYILDLSISYDGKKNNALRRFLSSILNKSFVLLNFDSGRRYTRLGWGGPASMTLTLTLTGKFYKILRELHADVHPAGDRCCVIYGGGMSYAPEQIRKSPGCGSRSRDHVLARAKL